MDKNFFGHKLKWSLKRGFDELGLYCNKKLDWTWIAQAVYFTLLCNGSGRSHKEQENRMDRRQRRAFPKDKFVNTDLFRGIKGWEASNNQVALAIA